jgi:three-Cys-motif partner protein
MPHSDDSEIQRLRLNSRAKHFILQDYLPTWASILGTYNDKLNYFDCFAGPGRYLWQGQLVDGSPIISIRACNDLLRSESRNKPRRINLVFVDEDARQVARLEQTVGQLESLHAGLKVSIKQYDSEKVIADILRDTRNLAPSFFFIDPYNHPFSLALMSEILKRPRTEIMVNFMYYQIIRDIENPMKQESCDKLFAPDDPHEIDIKTEARFDKNKMLLYLHRRLRSKYFVPFQVNFGRDEGVYPGRIKYLLIHYCNSFKAFNLMLNAMWKHGEPGKPMMVSDRQEILFPLKDVRSLRGEVVSSYGGTGKRVTFDAFCEENWTRYFLEKHCRAVLKDLEQAGIVAIERVSSKRDGLRENDIITFPKG